MNEERDEREKSSRNEYVRRELRFRFENLYLSVRSLFLHCHSTLLQLTHFIKFMKMLKISTLSLSLNLWRIKSKSNRVSKNRRRELF